MKHFEYYRGREQTYLKHFFLEKYLERVAYVIGSSYPEFVDVDGFSGPWKSEDQTFEDTSFIIAINVLRKVRDGLARIRKTPRIRCLFIEKDPEAFNALQSAVSHVSDFKVKALHGEFEQLIPDILQFIGRSFSLVFIDPTGWTGFGLRKITPILQHKPSEVLVNFMFDYINRFLDHPDHKIAQTIDALLGGPGWDTAIQAGKAREDAIVELYRERMRVAGGFKHVTSTRILKPISDRSYFYLVYGTRHPKGLIEFRNVEKKTIEEQEQVRLMAKQTHDVERTGQEKLFPATAFMAGPPSFEEERAFNLRKTESHLRVLLRGNQRLKYEEVIGVLLESPLVWESDIQQIIRNMSVAGELEVKGQAPRERTVKPGHILVSRVPETG